MRGDRGAAVMIRASVAAAVIGGAFGGGALGCSLADQDDDARIPLDEDLRVYARRAREGLHEMPPAQRAAIEPRLAAHEAAIARYDRLLARGGTQRAAQGTLIAAGAFMIKDDASGFGVADNVALPFVAIGIVGVTLLTASPAARDELTRGYRDVLDTAAELGKAMEASRPSDPSWQRARARERARETPDVQEGYDACRAFLQACLAVPAARGGLPTTRCFDCYRQCRGSGTGTWPRLRQCKFKGGP